MTSVLLRHSSRVHSRTLERAYRRKFLTVFGKFEPQNVVGHRVDPKKALPYVTTRFELLCATIHQRITSVGEPGKKIKKEEALYFTHFARRSLTTDWHKFWVTYSSLGRNELYKVLS